MQIRNTCLLFECEPDKEASKMRSHPYEERACQIIDALYGFALECAFDVGRDLNRVYIIDMFSFDWRRCCRMWTAYHA